jgi:addiction module HigA family antidote
MAVLRFQMLGADSTSRPRFIIYRGTATSTARSEQDPLRHLAKAIRISPNRITEIVNNRRRITADTALRLSLYFGNSPEFWMNLQSHYDLKMACSDLKPGDIKRIKAQRAA